MRYFLGILRLLSGVLTVLVFGSLIVLSRLVPGGRRGVRWPLWFLKWGTSALLFCFDIRVTCRQPERLHAHAGFIVANHLSYIDIAVLASQTPVRFLSKSEVRRVPVVGWAAVAIGCVFVQRGKSSSREAARAALAAAERFPPLIIFPEGACSFTPQMQPFHTGSFSVATAHAIPVLPCVIRYDPWQVAATIPGENELQTVWRLATHRGPLRVEVIPLPTVHPTPEEDGAQLADGVRAAMQAALTTAMGHVM